jgi:cytochrome c peroxidase
MEIGKKITCRTPSCQCLRLLLLTVFLPTWITRKHHLDRLEQLRRGYLPAREFAILWQAVTFCCANRCLYNPIKTMTADTWEESAKEMEQMSFSGGQVDGTGQRSLPRCCSYACTSTFYHHNKRRRNMIKNAMPSTVTLMLTLVAMSVSAGQQDDLVTVGRFLYTDKNLSVNQNQSCMTCHHPSAGYADPENLRDPIDFPVSKGSDPTLFGGRNAPSAAYAGFSPIFRLDADTGGYVGGMFWDGRATGLVLGDPLAEQALGPFENPVEMGMTRDAVVAAVSVSKYAELFLQVFNQADFTDVEGSYKNIGIAIAAFERSPAVTRFTSKFDQFWKACQEKGIDVSAINTLTDLATLPAGFLTTGQLRGLALFNDAGKGNCAACHPTTNYVESDGTALPPLFTDYTYDNLGIPTNPRVYELTGGNRPDLGLGGRDDIDDPLQLQDGKFKVPTLRNAAKTAPYGHNGYFPTLAEIVTFHNTRDVLPPAWEVPEVPENVTTTGGIGNLGLTRIEELQLVTFLMSLTDQH